MTAPLQVTVIFVPGYYFLRVSLQSPRQHQAKDRDDQPDMQKEVGCRQKVTGENKLDDQIDQDQEQPDDGKQSFSMSQKFRHVIQ